MAIPPGRRDQRREMVDQLQWRERPRRGAITLWFGQSVDNAFGIEQLQTLERERWAGTIAQQPLQTGAILRAHPHRGIQQEAAVLPSEYLVDVVWLD